MKRIDGEVAAESTDDIIVDFNDEVAEEAIVDITADFDDESILKVSLLKIVTLLKWL